MDAKARKYLDILKIELEDLITDLEFSETVLSKRLKEHEITEYVFIENLILLKREILCVEKVKSVVQASWEKNPDIEVLRETLEEYFRTEIREAGLPNAVLLLVLRKLDKVSAYMRLDEE